MKLFPPEQPIELYTDGFGEADPFGRKGTGEKLSALVENVEDPLVIAVDGVWGTGKTYFLRRWVGAHIHENSGSARTIYFDAFAHDFLDDPLTDITSAIDERLPQSEKGDAWAKVKQCGALLARPTLRMGLAAVAAGGSEILGAVGDAVLASGQKEVEKAGDEFWEREQGRRAAMSQFVQSLGNFTNEPAEGETPRKIAIVIDELDRCRPDYALSVLEVIKHFFSVPNVQFILGVNGDALESIIRARYGSDFDAGHYLHRFISLSISLPQTFERGRGDVASSYLMTTGTAMGLDNRFLELVSSCTKFVANNDLWSLRSAQRILTFTALASAGRNPGSMIEGYQHLLAIAVIIRALNPDLYARVLEKNSTTTELKDFFGIKSQKLGEGYDERKKYTLHGILAFMTGAHDEMSEDEMEQFGRSFSYSGDDGHWDDLIRIISNHIEVYSFPETDLPE